MKWFQKCKANSQWRRRWLIVSSYLPQSMQVLAIFSEYKPLLWILLSYRSCLPPPTSNKQNHTTRLPQEPEKEGSAKARLERPGREIFRSWERFQMQMSFSSLYIKVLEKRCISHANAELSWTILPKTHHCQPEHNTLQPISFFRDYPKQSTKITT